MASGLPVVSARSGGIPEYLGPDGVYVDPRDAVHFADALHALLTCPTEREQPRPRPAHARRVHDVGAQRRRADAPAGRLSREHARGPGWQDVHRDGTASSTARPPSRRSSSSSPSGSRASREQGVVPGLGTVLVGDDPGSHWYVNAKHKDCAEIGITSIRRDLAATATPGRGRGRHRRAQRRPGLHRLPRPAAHGTRRDGPALARRPREGRRRPAPDEPRLARARQAGAAARARRWAASSCCAASTCRSPAPRSSSSAAASPSAARSVSSSRARARTPP